MKHLAPFIFAITVIAIMAYIVWRDSKVDQGAKPLTVTIGKYVITPSRWFWRKVRENKAAVAGVIIAAGLLFALSGCAALDTFVVCTLVECKK